jgi:multidrug resistance protein, MATE family
MLCEGPVTGMNTTISILVSIAFGNQNMKQCEEALQIGRVISACTFACTLFLLSFTYPLLRFFEIDHDLAYSTAYFVACSTPAFFFHLQFDCNRQFLNSTLNSSVVMNAVSFSTLLHIFWCWLFIIKLDLGITGAAMANGVHTFTCLAISQFGMRFQIEPRVPIISVPTLEMFQSKRTSQYLKLGLPSIGTICLEWWGIEILVMMSGVFSTTAVAAQAIAQNFQTLIQMMPSGLQTGIVTCVGNSIGEGSLYKTKISSAIGLTY